MRCWQCGVEPLEVHDICTLEQAEPVRSIPVWPVGDHEHAEREPTPSELDQAGHDTLMRIRGAAG